MKNAWHHSNHESAHGVGEDYKIRRICERNKNFNEEYC